MIKLHLFRHGETNWNAEGRVQGQMESVLNELGEQQARALSQKLLSVQFDRIYSSSSTRTRQTTALALAHCDQPVTYLDSLKEIMLGPWEGLLYTDLEQTDPIDSHAFRNTPHTFNVEGAETFHDLQQRALNAVNIIVSECKGMEVALVSHGAWIKSVLSHYEGRPIERFWEEPRMPNCCHSVIEIDTDNGKARIIKYADLDEGF